LERKHVVRHGVITRSSLSGKWPWRDGLTLNTYPRPNSIE
jgi:hypothetical protein